MTQTEALKQALEALEESGITWKISRAITAIKEVLAQPEQEPTYTSTQATNCAGCGKHKHTPLRIDAMGGYVCLTCIDTKLGSLLGEFGYEQLEQEPVAWLNEEKKIIYWHNTHETDDYHGFKRTTPLYTTPPQRTWVGLTDEDIRQCSRDVVAGGKENCVDRFAYAVGAKLKEKNNA